MKGNKKPELSLFLPPVDSSNGEKGQRKAEGGDEVNCLFFLGALAKVGRTEDTIDGHHGDVG